MKSSEFSRRRQTRWRRRFARTSLNLRRSPDQRDIGFAPILVIDPVCSEGPV